MAQQTKRFYQFGEFHLDVAERVLLRDGKPVPLVPKALETLFVLVEKHGHIVEKEDLLKRVWSNTFVEEGAVAQCVFALRKVLGDTPEGHAYIETVPRRGYRFVASVEELGRKPVTEVTPSEEATIALPKARLRYVRHAALAILLALIVVGYFARHSLGWHTAAPAGKVMLAVLPFVNMDGDPEQEYFSNGMTEEMITQLGRLEPERLGVIARTSAMQYKSTQKDTRQIGSTLGVDYILEGSVRRVGGRVRITAQLIQVRDQSHLWAEDYDRDLRDILALQSEVAGAIAQQIRLKLTPEQRAKLHSTVPVNPEAYENYLKGRFFWNKRTVEGHQKAIEFFDRAITLDPSYAQAYAGRADAYALLGSWPNFLLPRREAMTRAREAAQKALSLNESLAEAHTSLGFVKMHYDWDFRGAEKEFLRAIALNPGYATAHHWYAYDLVALGRLEDAVAQAWLAQKADPLSVIISRDVGEMLLFAGRDDEAIDQCQRSLEMDPAFYHAHWTLAWAYRRKGRQKEFLDEILKATSSPGGLYPGLFYALTGRKLEAHRAVAKLQQAVLRRYSSGHDVALLYAYLGDRDRAFVWLENTFRERDGGLILLRVAPEWEPLRSDPRFEQLARRVGLPQ